MARKFTRRRWRRPERLTLEHPPVRRRKDIGAPTQLPLEPAIARRSSRRRLESLLVLFLFLCALEGVVLALATGRWLLVPIVTGLGIAYFFFGREWGDGWVRRALRARGGASTRLSRLATAEARSAGVPPPDVLITPGVEPNALALSLRKRSIVLTEACEGLDELVLEAMIAHEVVHLRDGEAAVASLYLVLAGAPELLFRRAGAACLLGVPLWPVAFAMRLARSMVMPADREHRADVAGAMLTRYPPGLVDALTTAGGSTCGLGLADGIWFVARNGAPGEAARRAQLVGEM